MASLCQGSAFAAAVLTLCCACEDYYLLSELVAHLVPKRFVPMRNQLFIMKECLRFVIATGFCLCTPYRIVLACSGVNLCGE